MSPYLFKKFSIILVRDRTNIIFMQLNFQYLSCNVISPFYRSIEISSVNGMIGVLSFSSMSRRSQTAETLTCNKHVLSRRVWFRISCLSRPLNHQIIRINGSAYERIRKLLENKDMKPRTSALCLKRIDVLANFKFSS